MYKTTRLPRPVEPVDVSLLSRTGGRRSTKRRQRDQEDSRATVRADRRVIHVMLVDTHVLMLKALLRVVANFPQVEIVAQMQTTEAMLTFLEKTAVDVVVFGVSIPASVCLQFTHSVGGNHPNLGIVVIQPHLRLETAFTLVKQGIHGLLDEFASEQDLADAISTVASGSSFFNKHARETLISSMSRATFHLTARELEVAVLLRHGTSNFRIAQTLGLKEKTIEAYLTNIYSKLGVNSRVEAMLYLQDLQI
jgi:DNA-binding NarL/FixJ family response regulator